MQPGEPATSAAGAVVELTIWGVPSRRIPAALVRMALDRPGLRPNGRGPAGLRFAKLLGTGSGETFAMRDADPHHWALLTVWDTPGDVAAFRAGRLHQAWNRLAHERLTVELEAVAARGQWARREPFAVPLSPGTATGPVTGPVAAITRARLRPSRAVSFWRAVPPVAQQLHQQEGLLLAISFGEAPLGLAGTFSLWSSQAAMTTFVHLTPAHVQAIRQTGPQRWYAEELFARFRVVSVQGRYRGQEFAISSPDGPADATGPGGPAGVTRGVS